jgi:hypothetical protein
LRSDLAEDLIGKAVQYSRVSGNTAFELLILLGYFASIGAKLLVSASAFAG